MRAIAGRIGCGKWYNIVMKKNRQLRILLGVAVALWLPLIILVVTVEVVNWWHGYSFDLAVKNQQLTANQQTIEGSLIAYDGSKDVDLIDDALGYAYHWGNLVYYQFADNGQNFLAFRVVSREKVLETEPIAITAVEVNALDYRPDDTVVIDLTVKSTASVSDEPEGSKFNQINSVSFRQLMMVPADALMIIPIEQQVSGVIIDGQEYQPFAGGWVWRKNDTYVLVDAEMKVLTEKVYEGYFSLGGLVTYVDKNGQEQTYDWSGITRATSECGNDLLTADGKVILSCLKGNISHYAPGLLITEWYDSGDFFGTVKTGVIDLDGNVVRPLIDGWFSGTSDLHNDSADFTDARTYKVYAYHDPNKATVALNGRKDYHHDDQRVGVIDHDFQVVLPPIYKEITIMQRCEKGQSECETVFEVEKDGQKATINARDLLKTAKSHR